MKTEIKEFSSEMIAPAARLLAVQHAANRKVQPLLPARFEQVSACEEALRALLTEKHVRGFAAVRDGALVGYLIGAFASQAWGRSGYVYLPGYGLAQNENPRTIQDLYSALGEDWIRQGIFYHALYVCAADTRIIQALFDLGFGKERVDALLDLRTVKIPETEAPSGITTRRAEAGDEPLVASLSDVIFRSLAEAPYWHPTMPEDWDELKESWGELASDPEWTIWIGIEKGSALGTVGFRPEKEAPAQLLVSPGTIYLSVAATKPQARGRGLSTHMTWKGLEQARSEGYEICYTNWVSPNLLAARHWPRYGFQDVAYRLAKKVNPMIAWTRPEA